MEGLCGRGNPGTESAGINRHIVGDERALRKRRSDSILASSPACDLVRDDSEAWDGNGDGTVMNPKSETRRQGRKWGHSAVIMEMTDEQTEAL
jgi:hypothetical protein